MNPRAAGPALVDAANVARLAPSVHNTQPWRWTVGTHLDLYADRRRQLTVADPDGRLLHVSCGASLHHARLALAAAGWLAEVARLADPADADHLARVSVRRPVRVSPDTLRMYQAIRLRHTDRRPVSDEPVPHSAVEALREAAEAERVHLHELRADQVGDLAVAARQADAITLADPAQRAETARWVGGEREDGLGVPDAAIPSRPPATPVPARAFGPTGSLDPGDGHDRYAVYALLFGPGDAPVDWLRAGEALSAVWLTAVGYGLSVMPISSVIEVPGTREQARRMLAGTGQPYLALRVGMTDTERGPAPRTGRAADDAPDGTSDGTRRVRRTRRTPDRPGDGMREE